MVASIYGCLCGLFHTDSCVFAVGQNDEDCKRMAETMTSLEKHLDGGVSCSKMCIPADGVLPENVILQYAEKEFVRVVVLGSHHSIIPSYHRDFRSSSESVGSFTQMAFCTVRKPCVGQRPHPSHDSSRLQKLVVPIDGTHFSELAIKMAVDIQKGMGSTLSIIHAVENNEGYFHLTQEEAVKEREGMIEAGTQLLAVALELAATLGGDKTKASSPSAPPPSSLLLLTTTTPTERLQRCC